MKKNMGMKGVQTRTLNILELLSKHADGLALASIADQLKIPRSAAHRLLSDLVASGYVRQMREHGDYLLTTKLVSMGLTFLSNSGIIDIAQPLLDHLAEVSGELVRLSVADGERLTWVARAQGARQGLRYDPDMGTDAHVPFIPVKDDAVRPSVIRYRLLDDLEGAVGGGVVRDDDLERGIGLRQGALDSFPHESLGPVTDHGHGHQRTFLHLRNIVLNMNLYSSRERYR